MFSWPFSQLMLSEPEVLDRTPPDPVVTPCIRNTVEAIIPRLKDFHQILVEPPQVIHTVKSSCTSVTNVLMVRWFLTSRKMGLKCLAEPVSNLLASSGCN
jgi:hypothetical protein